MNGSDTGLMAWWPLDEDSGSLAADRVSQTRDPVSYVFNNARHKPASDPLWSAGLQGGALLFDGYSTWITRAVEHMPVPEDALSVAVWIAPRAFEHGAEGRLSAIVNQHDREAGQGYILGLYRHGTWSLQVGVGGEWLEVWSDAPLIPRDRWSYLLATFDGRAGRMALYLNGEEVASKDVPRASKITPCNVDLLIGKNNQAACIGNVFAANMVNGLLDEVKIYNRALAPGEVAANHAAYRRGFPEGVLPVPDTSQRRSRYTGDRRRPEFHFIPPEHWMNEPHAPLYFAGQYHLFYQHNPHGPYWHHIHWGHAVSPDLVHWRDLPFALAPEKDEVDPDGDWSGSAVIDDDGVPTLLFTAGDNTKSPNQSVAIARSTFNEDGDKDLVHWVKHKERVAIQEPGIGRFGEFRDPFGWKDGETWYMLVGSGIPNYGGTALLYSSLDLIHWTYHHPFYSTDLQKYPKTGEVWELPVFLPLGYDQSGVEKFILLANPWYSDGRHPYYCKYVFHWVGTWDRANQRFVPDDEEPQVYDLGEHAIGPSGMIDPQGRVIIFTVVFGGQTTPQQTYDLGWAHNAGLPVILKLRDNGRIGVEPLPELESLREERLVAFEHKAVDEANRLLQGIGGETLEILVRFEAGAAGRYGLKLCATPDGEEETLLLYDAGRSTLQVDRSKSSRDPSAERGLVGGTLELEGQPLQLRIYLDHSMLEAYANGLKSLTTRVYPSRPDALGLQLWADRRINVESMQVWRLGSAYRQQDP